MAAVVAGSGVALGSTPADAACKKSDPLCTLRYHGLYLHHGNDPSKGISVELDRTTTAYNKLRKNFAAGPQGDLLEMLARLRDREDDGRAPYLQWRVYANVTGGVRRLTGIRLLGPSVEAQGSDVADKGSGSVRLRLLPTAPRRTAARRRWP